MAYETPWRCKSCYWIGKEAEMLVAANPFDPDSKVHGCPECKQVDDFEEVCDEPGCSRDAGCGFPTPDGYRRTCFEHSAFNKKTAPAMGDEHG